MEHRPAVSFVFVNYNSASFLERALGSLEKSEPLLDKEIIVVDNGSRNSGRVKNLCRAHSCRLLQLKRNLGYGRAANRGARYARGRFILVANPDVQFTPNSATKLLQFMEDNPTAGVVSPQLFYPDGTPQPSARRFPKFRYVFAGRRSPVVRIFPNYLRAREFLYADSWRARAPFEVEAVIGTCMLFRGSAWADAGGFDEGYFMFAEDMDICYRLRKKGWRVYIVPDARVIHHYGGVRRRWRRFTEFQRIKGLYRFFTAGKRWPVRMLLTVASAGYFFVIEGAGVAGLGEFEYSWRLPASSLSSPLRGED